MTTPRKDAGGAIDAGVLARHEIACLARVIVGGLFIYAAQAKIAQPDQFARDIRAYEIFPEVVTNAMAYTVPWLEAITGLLLIVHLFLRFEARLIIAIMLVSFTALKVAVLAAGRTLDCGCFGDTLIGKLSSGVNGVYFNLALLGLLLLEWVMQPRTKRVRRKEHAPAAEHQPREVAAAR